VQILTAVGLDFSFGILFPYIILKNFSSEINEQKAAHKYTSEY
jgi:hypothetical protein